MIGFWYLFGPHFGRFGRPWSTNLMIFSKLRSFRRGRKSFSFIVASWPQTPKFELKFVQCLVILRVGGHPRKHLETPLGQECRLKRFLEMPSPVLGCIGGLRASHLSPQIGSGRGRYAKTSIKRSASHVHCYRAGFHIARRWLRLVVLALKHSK